MNITILVSGLPPDCIGGAELQAARAAQYLARAHRVTVLTRTASVPNELRSVAACAVVQRSRVPIRGLRFAADLVQTLGHLWRERRRTDVILAYQTVIDGLIAVIARLLFGIPAMVSVRSGGEFLDRSLQVRVLTPFVLRHADRIAVQSQRLADGLLVASVERDGLAAKLCVLPNGIAPPPDLPPAGGDTVLFVGRLFKVKAVDTLIDAMRRCPHERLVIVGDGPERSALEQQARELQNVVFAGMLAPDVVGDYLRRAKVLVLPSIEEGQPNVVMEAMRHGVPVIATRVGGVPDLVKDGRTGFLVEPGDPDALADRISALCADASLRRAMALAGLDEIRQYGWDVVVGQLERELSLAARRPQVPQATS